MDMFRRFTCSIKRWILFSLFLACAGHANVWETVDDLNTAVAKVFHESCHTHVMPPPCPACTDKEGGPRKPPGEVICQGGDIAENAYLAVQAEKRLPDLRCALTQADDIKDIKSYADKFAEQLAEALQKIMDLR